MSPSQKPSVVICCGSWHVPAHYEPLIKALESEGYEVKCPALPSNQVIDKTPAELEKNNEDPAPPPGGFDTGDKDVPVVTKEIKAFIAQGKKVVLLGHGYGAWVASEATTAELLPKKNNGAGIEAIIFLAGVIVPVGQSQHGYFSPPDGSIPPYGHLVYGGKHGKDGVTIPANREEYYFPDHSPEEAKRNASMLVAQSCATTPLTHNTYASLPLYYRYYKDDKILPLAAQEIMVKNAIAEGAKVSTSLQSGGLNQHLVDPKPLVHDMVRFIETNVSA